MGSSCLFLLLAIIVHASANPNERIFEQELTQIIQKYLAPQDPTTVPSITNINITTDSCSLMYNSTNNVISGFGSMVVTKFSPPFLSKEMTMLTEVDTLQAHTTSYKVNGTLNGNPYTATGIGNLVMKGVHLTLKCKADSYSIAPTVSICIEKGTLSIGATADSLTANFQGADELNDYINTHKDVITQLVNEELKENAGSFEDSINKSMCKS
ncbi:hypothetical protein SK128_008224 [Halocaridina rubra]|uniref:Secreted protein n=1 Tax=Halocaridina rubra TaxID=373956 RepID=A0AAN8XJ49_HALRR